VKTIRTDKTHSKPVKAPTSPKASKVIKSGKLAHPASAKCKSC
jgi:hypothetical protein